MKKTMNYLVLLTLPLITVNINQAAQNNDNLFVKQLSLAKENFQQLITVQDTAKQLVQIVKINASPKVPLLNQGDQPCNGQDPDTGPCNVKIEKDTVKSNARSRKKG